MAKIFYDIREIKKGHGSEKAFTVGGCGDISGLCGRTNSNGQSFIAPPEGLFGPMSGRIFLL
jgi:hypothetical protein